MNLRGDEVSNITSNYNYSPTVDNGSEYAKMKKELAELEAKFEQLCQELFKIIQEVVALVASGTPASSPEWAKLGGEIDTITDQSNKLSSEIKLLQTQMSYAPIRELALSMPLDAARIHILQGLLQEAKQLQEKQSQSEQKLEEIRKALTQAVQAMIKTVVSHGTQSNTQLEQLVQELKQLTNLLSQLHDSDQSPKNLSNKSEGTF